MLTETIFSPCSHVRALEYYIESITSNIGFYAVKCSRRKIFLGWCEFESSTEENVAIVGEPCTPPQQK